MRVFLAALVAVLCANTAAATGFGAHVLGGLTFGEDLPDARVENPAFHVGAGLNYGVTRNVVFLGSATYASFWRYVSDVPTDVGDSGIDGNLRTFEVDVTVRVSPSGVTPPGAPVIYFLFSTGGALMFRNPAPEGEDGDSEYTFGALGLGFEVDMSGRKKFFMQFSGKVTSNEAGKYFPLTAGLRF